MAAPDQRPILVLTAGGTIDKVYFDSLSRYEVGEPMIAELLRIGRAAHPHRVAALFQKDSLELTDADRASIARTVAGAPETAVVITHGTDTMTLTAAALASIEGKTIVLVGALSPARFRESDALFNLGMAFAAAQLAPPGIYVAMSGSVFPAAHVEKDRDQERFVAVQPSEPPAGNP